MLVGKTVDDTEMVLAGLVDDLRIHAHAGPDIGEQIVLANELGQFRATHPAGDFPVFERRPKRGAFGSGFFCGQLEIVIHRGPQKWTQIVNPGDRENRPDTLERYR